MNALGWSAERAGVVGVDARQVELGKELGRVVALGGGLLQRRQGGCVGARLVGGETLLEFHLA